MKDILERKIKYNSEIVDHRCKLLEIQDQGIKLFHVIDTTFTMIVGNAELTIPKGSYTVACYWEDRPYNLYYWRDRDGKFLGAYFNIVKNTKISLEMVSFEDLIIDILVLPNGEYNVLDEEELPVPIEQFEEGKVKSVLNMMFSDLFLILNEVEKEVANKYNHERLLNNLSN